MNQSAGLARGVLSGEALGLEPANDDDLARCGDQHRFGLLYERHLPALYRYLSGRVGTREEAEDLASDVFQLAWRNRGTYRGHGTVRAWLFAIARRRLADHYRRAEITLALEPRHQDVRDQEVSPEEALIDDEHTQRLRQLLERLTAEKQEILRLRFGAELTYAEIAVVIGKREDAVKKMAYRALEHLRGSMADASNI
jgi:RNA polymerase sigma-70 factor, ECF subfamily